MSHVDAGPLAGYNSLLDPHLAGYFSNTRMKRHLVKSGLITRRGNIVSENTYRLNMARKEHKKHVRDLLAQAIVHKTLDLERTRQVAIKQKLEEIAKIEMVRRVKESCNRHGDEDLLPYLKPSHKNGSRPSSVPSGSSRKSSEQMRPVSAPSKSHDKRSRSTEGQRGQTFMMLDEEGMPRSTRGRSASGSSDSDSRGRRSARGRSKSTSKYPTEELDDRHLYSLNSQSLRDYTMARYDMDSTRGPSPYRLPQLPPDMMPTPPTSRSPRSTNRPQHRGRSAKSQSKQTNTSRSNRGQLMLHRQEPAMKHQERVQTLCDVNMHYFGNSLSLEYERFDPRDEVMVEQQHCGGNTLIVFREKILPGNDFTFTSRRHRGYPFSLTFYVNGVLDCRLSTCCEYKHQSGARLGGKQGHFGMIGIDGTSPCYRCQINNTNNKKKRKRKLKGKKEADDEDENVHVAVEEDDKNSKDVNVRGIGDDQDIHMVKDDSIEVPVEDAMSGYHYSDEDFEEGEEKKSETSSRSLSSYSSSRSSSSSSSISRSSSPSQSSNDVLWNITVYTSKKQFAGTDAQVYIILHGDMPSKKNVKSDKIILDNSDDNFEKGRKDEFKRDAPNFEKLTKIRIGHDNSGTASAWHLDRVILENTLTGKSFIFHCNNWVSGCEDDNVVERELYPAGSDETKQSSKTPKVKWNVRVNTSDIPHAGTDADVYVLLTGELKNGRLKESEKIILDNSSNNFERNQCDQFTIETYDYANLTKLRIGHNNKSLGSAWHLNKITFENSESGKSYTFHCNKWLADNKDDQAIERELFPAGSEQARKSDTAKKSKWSIKVYTSDIRNAGTDSDVYIVLIGETEDGEVKESDKMILDNNKNNFERSQCDEFDIETYDYVRLRKLRIGHNNNGLGAAWHLNKVMLENRSSGVKYTFPCNKWLADDEGDCAVERELEPSDKSDEEPVVDELQERNDEQCEMSDEASHNISSTSSSSASLRSIDAEDASAMPVKIKAERVESTAVGKDYPDHSIRVDDEDSARSSADNGSPKDGHKDSPRTNDKDSPRGNYKSPPRGSDEGSLSKSDKDSQTSSDKDSTTGSNKSSPGSREKGSPNNSYKGSLRGSDKNSSRSTDKGSPRSIDRNSSNNSDNGPTRNSHNERALAAEKGEGKNMKSSPSSSSLSSSDSSDSSDGDEEDHKQVQSSQQPTNEGVERNDKEATDPVTSGQIKDSSIRPLVEGRKNIELVNKKLNEDQIRELCDAIRETGEVETLVLRHSDIGDDDLEKVAAAVNSTRSEDLEMLNLNFNGITAAGVHHLVDIIKNKPNLQILLLHNTAIGDEGLDVLVDALLQVNEAVDEDTKAIKEAAKGMVLNVIKNATETASTVDTEESRSSSDITSVGESENERLISKLEGLHRQGALNLEQLDIGDCQIGEHGINSLARLIRANTSLEHICLTGNKAISPSAWERLGEALQNNTSLCECGLDYTDMRDQGVIHFLGGAEGNKSLQSLDLEGNKIGDEGGRRILDFLRSHPNLKDVNLMPGNHINPSLLDEIKREIAERN